MNIVANDIDYKLLNDKIRDKGKTITVKNCLGQRFIAAGMNDKNITIEGIPGNALGAYLNGAKYYSSRKCARCHWRYYERG